MLQVVKADFEDPDSLAEVFRGCDAVFAVTGEAVLPLGWLLLQCRRQAWLGGRACCIDRATAIVALPFSSCRHAQTVTCPPSLRWRADFWQACQLDAEREKKQGT